MILKKSQGTGTFSETEHIVDTSGLWIVPYADFMTVIMIFFMLMFAFAYAAKTDKRYKKIVTSIQEEMGGTVNEKLIKKMVEQEKAEQMVSKFDEIAAEKGLSKYINVNLDSDKIKIVFANPILFKVGSADFKPESKTILHDVAAVIKGTPNEIIVEGHTDNVPISASKYKSNWELSVARAMSVVRFFIDTEEIIPQRLVAAGYGEFRPILPNTSEENRAQNRRIEIDILRKEENK